MNIRIENKGREQFGEPHHSHKNKQSKPHGTQFRGMTLKEYFRLSEAVLNDQDQIRQTDEQDKCSSTVQTPCFNQYNSRQKIKTQVYEEKSLVEDKASFVIKDKHKNFFPFDNKTKQLKLDLPPNEPSRVKPAKKGKNKRLNTLASCQKDQLNRSTITSFYHFEDKKKKMLEKVKNEKERINDLKLSDAFFITKYAQKFKIPKNAY